MYWTFESRKPGDELFTQHQCLRASPRAISGLRDYQRGCCPSACLESVLPSSEQSFALGQPPADAPHRLCLCHGQVLPAEQSVRRGSPYQYETYRCTCGLQPPHWSLKAEPNARGCQRSASMAKHLGSSIGCQKSVDWKVPVHLWCRGQLRVYGGPRRRMVVQQPLRPAPPNIHLYPAPRKHRRHVADTVPLYDHLQQPPASQTAYTWQNARRHPTP